MYGTGEANAFRSRFSIVACVTARNTISYAVSISLITVSGPTKGARTRPPAAARGNNARVLYNTFRYASVYVRRVRSRLRAYLRVIYSPESELYRTPSLPSVVRVITRRTGKSRGRMGSVTTIRRTIIIVVVGVRRPRPLCEPVVPSTIGDVAKYSVDYFSLIYRRERIYARFRIAY